MPHKTRAQKIILIAILVLLGLGSSKEVSAGINFWSSIGPEGNYNITALVVAPTTPATLYAGTDDGLIFKSTNSGGNWVSADTGLAGLSVEVLAIEPGTPTTLYAGTWKSVYKSTNSGGNWDLVGSTPYVVHSIAIAPNLPSTLYIANYDGVYQSPNRGGNWYFAGLYNADVRVLAVEPTDSASVYAGTWGHGLFKSINSGVQWTAVMTDGLYVYNLAIAPTSPATIYVTTNQGLYRSTNGGGSWSLVNANSPWVLAVDPTTPTTVYATLSLNAIYKSINNGITWTAVGGEELIYENVQALAIDPITPTTVYAGTQSDSVYAIQQINSPVPTLTSISPSTKNVGDTTFTLTLTGTNFINGSVVKWGAADLTTTFGSDTNLSATIPDSFLNTWGAVPIKVFNPAPGGGTSNALIFNIQYPYRLYLPLIVR